MIDFATNYNYLGPPSGLYDFARNNIETAIGCYINYQDTSMYEAVGEYFNVPPDNIAYGNGASEIIYGLPKVLDKDTAVSFTPSFWEYASANERSDVSFDVIDLIPEDNFAYDLNKLEAKLNVGPAAVYMCNPNNPTGSMLSKSEILNLASTYPSSDFVVDETYMQFREDFEEATLSQAAISSGNIHVVHSFSKFFTSPGLRSGALVSNADTVTAFKNTQSPHSMSPLSHISTPWLLMQKDFVIETRKQIAAHKINVLRDLESSFSETISFTYPNANFIFAKVRQKRLNVASKLAERFISVRDGKVWGDNMEDYFRFCIRGSHDMDLLIQGLSDITS